MLPRADDFKMPPFNFQAFPILETERLILRELVDEDTSAIFCIRGDQRVTQYNEGPAYRRPEQALRLIQAIRDGYENQKEIRWGITWRDSDDRVIGMCGFNYWNRRDRRASIGYDLAHAHWGQGLMPEALRAVVAFGFEQMELNRIEADCTLENAASARVLEKLGFQEEGLQREQYFEAGRFWDLRLFALLRRDYISTVKAAR